MADLEESTEEREWFICVCRFLVLLVENLLWIMLRFWDSILLMRKRSFCVYKYLGFSSSTSRQASHFLTHLIHTFMLFFTTSFFFSRNVFTDKACLSQTLQKSSIQEAPSSCSHCRCVFVDHRLFVLSCTQQNTFRGINLLLTIWTALWSPWSCLASALTGCSHTLPSSAQCGATPNEERKIKSLQNVQQLSTNDVSLPKAGPLFTGVDG